LRKDRPSEAIRETLVATYRILRVEAHMRGYGRVGLGRLFLCAGIAVPAAVGLVASVVAGKPRPLAPLAWLPPAPAPAPTPQAAQRSGGPALRFERNEGQFDERVRYLARGRDYMAVLTDGDVRLALRRPKDAAAPADNDRDRRFTERQSARAAVTPFDESVVGLRVVGGKRVSPVAAEPLAGVTNYFVGSNRSRWRTGVGGFASVRYPEVLPGVDLALHGGGDGRLEYDIVLAAGQDPAKVALAFDGATSIAVAPGGEAVLGLAGGIELREHVPVAYQTDARGARTQVPVRYQLRPDRTLAFAVGAHDVRRPLVIDPVLAYSTYHGGGGADVGASIAVDSTGAAYVTGTTASPDLFVLGAIGPAGASLAGGTDAFIAKFGPTGAHVSSTFLGGSGDDQGTGIALDQNGNIYVTGGTSSPNFPSASNTLAGLTDAFVVKLNPAASALLYSRYLGGSADDASLWPPSIAVDSAGSAFVAGTTKSTNFPVVGAVQPTFGGVQDAFITKLETTIGAIVYSSYLGGSAAEQGNAVAVDAGGTAFVTGHTASPNFPTLPVAARDDAFVVKITGNGNAFGYVQVIGGALGQEVGWGIALAFGQTAYVTGSTTSPDFPIPVSPGPLPFQTALKGSMDAFVAQLHPTTGALLYATFLGGNVDLGPGTGEGNNGSIAVDATGNMFVTGATNTANFPTQSPIAGVHGGGIDDVYVTELNAAGSALVFSTFLGGTGADQGHGIAIDGSGGIYVTGTTASSNFPTLAPAQPRSGSGGTDAFVTKIVPQGVAQFMWGNQATTCPGSKIATGGQLTVSFLPLGGDGTCPGCDAAPRYNSTGALDVLRVLYAGYHHDGTYDCNSGVRNALVSNWPSLFTTTCANQGTCPGITHAWRQADGAAVTAAFINLVGFGGRTVYSGVNPFCNSVSAVAGTAGAEGDGDYSDADPIRIPCDPNDTVCEIDGTLGLVLPIVLPAAGATSADEYPASSAGACSGCVLSQTGGGNGLPCPRGGPLLLGRCFQPATAAGDTHCIANRAKRCFGDITTLPSGKAADGRVYNLPLKVASGAEPAKYLVDASGRRMTGSFFRIHMNAPSSYSQAGPTCQLTSADPQIGCLVSSDACSLGDAGTAAGGGTNQQL
jgi:hypothetical protein